MPSLLDCEIFALTSLYKNEMINQEVKALVFEVLEIN